MADPLNTLGFVSWGLLGSAEGGEGPGETIYVLDMPVEVEMVSMDVEIEIAGPEVEADTSDLSAAVEVDGPEVAVELEDMEA